MQWLEIINNNKDKFILEIIIKKIKIVNLDNQNIFLQIKIIINVKIIMLKSIKIKIS
jgi:hypothetical protein